MRSVPQTPGFRATTGPRCGSHRSRHFSYRSPQPSQARGLRGCAESRKDAVEQVRGRSSAPVPEDCCSPYLPVLWLLTQAVSYLLPLLSQRILIYPRAVLWNLRKIQDMWSLRCVCDLPCAHAMSNLIWPSKTEASGRSKTNWCKLIRLF